MSGLRYLLGGLVVAARVRPTRERFYGWSISR